MIRNSGYWINKLELLPHPEGGYYKEIYRSTESISRDGLPNRFSGSRSLATSIYFLLEKGQFSTFHRIKSDEIWHFYDGDPVIVYEITSDGILIIHKLGLDINAGYLPQITVNAGNWFAAEPSGDFTLVGCTVSPGFSFEDFEMGNKEILTSSFPEHTELINRLTK